MWRFAPGAGPIFFDRPPVDHTFILSGFSILQYSDWNFAVLISIPESMILLVSLGCLVKLSN